MYFVTMVSPNSSSFIGCSAFCSLASSSCSPKAFRKNPRHSATGRSCAVSAFWRKLWAMVSWNALPNAVAAVPGSLRSRRYRNIHLAGQLKNCETWLGESTSAMVTEPITVLRQAYGVPRRRIRSQNAWTSSTGTGTLLTSFVLLWVTGLQAACRFGAHIEYSHGRYNQGFHKPTRTGFVQVSLNSSWLPKLDRIKPCLCPTD